MKPSMITAEATERGWNVDSDMFAKQMDEIDTLAKFRDEFHIPLARDFVKTSTQTIGDDEKVIYLTGNSLGLQPKQTQAQLESYLVDWRKYAVEGHHKGDHPWISIDEEVQEALSKVVGCQPQECAPMNTLSVNLHMMMVRFYKPTATRFKIVIEQGAFPSDLYVAESQLQFHGRKPETDLIKLMPREGEHTLRNEDIYATLSEHGDSIALVMLSGVQFFTGQYFDIKAITAHAHSVGAMVGWDLAHAAGNLELKLHKWDVDFACWCSYKYLNSGPGCIGGLFIHSKHTEKYDLATDTRFRGWFGNRLSNRFRKEMEFVAEEGALGFRCSNPSVADVTSLRSSLDITNRAGIYNLRAKSLLLTSYLEHLLLAKIHANNPVEIITPKDPHQRGCQLSLLLGGNIVANQLKTTLLDNGVVCDVREPNVIRVAPTPLYNSFTDVKNFVDRLEKALANQLQQ
eukprot:gene15613-18552_t